MKPIRFAGILLGVGFCLVSLASLVPVAAQEKKEPTLSPEEIVEKHIKAVGGREALQSIKTLMTKGRNIGLGAEDRPLVRYYKQPNLLRQEVPGGSNFIASDGRKVYEVTASGRTEVAQAWTATFLHTTIDGDFLQGTKGEIRYEYVGSERIKTGPWTFHHLRRTFPDGYAEDLYFEAESGLLRMVVEQDGRAKRVLFEYREVGGILYPHLVATVFEGREPPHVFVTDEVKLNPDLETGFFPKPE